MVEMFGRGGLLHYSWQLAQALAERGLEVTLLTGRAREPGVGEGAAPSGARLRAELNTWNPQGRPRGLPPALLRMVRGGRYLLAWRQVLAVARQQQPQLVLLGDLEHRLDAWAVGRLRRAGRWQLADIWHNVEMFERRRPGRVVRRAAWRWRMARAFDRVFVHGERLRAELERATGVGATVIPHGNQQWLLELAGPDPGLRERLQIDPARPVALLVGALSAYKGVGVLLEALALVAARERPQVVVAGMPTAGVRVEPWRRQAERLGVAAALRWDLHYVPTAELAWYMRLADCVVLPYLAASQSGVAHLAMTAARPIIVSDAGSLAELVDGNGLVVAAGSAPELAAALRRLAGDAALRRRMGERSRELALTRHSWQRVAAGVCAACGLAPDAPLPLSGRGGGTASKAECIPTAKVASEGAASRELLRL
ncbi:MAG: glycosyltransferase family 4 protein [Terriglobales bacterium]